MGLLEVLRTVVISFHPLRYRELARERSKKVFKHMFYFIVCVFLFSSLLSVPGFLSFQSNLESEFSKIQKFEIKGDLKTKGPVEITSGVFLDTSDTKKIITDEKVLITKDNFYFNLFGPMKIRIDRILNPMKYKTHFVSAVSMLVLFLMPSIILFLLGLFFVKYVLITLVTGTIVFFFLRILLLFRVRARNVFNICFLAAIPSICFEGIISPFFPKLLVPLFGFLSLKLNLIPLLIYLTFAVLGMVFVEKQMHIFKKKKQEEKTEKEKEEKLDWGF